MIALGAVGRLASRLRGVAAASILLAAASILLSAGGALADPIGPDCGTCQGSVYWLDALPDPIATTATTQTFRITLTIDSSGYTGGGSGIDTVAIKVSHAIVSAALVDAPLGVSNWISQSNRGLNAGGCSKGGMGFECAAVDLRSASIAGVPAVGGTLRWEWDLEVDPGSLLSGPDGASLKVRYVDDARGKVGALVSEELTLGTGGGVIPVPVPEPGSFGLLAAGLAALVARARRGARGPR